MQRLILSALPLLAACLGTTPTKAVADASSRCGPIAADASCVVLHVEVTDDVARTAPGDLVGDLHWALYRDGDVGLLGPGAHVALYGDTVPKVDLSAPHAAVEVVVPAVPAQSLQALAFLDDDGDGVSDTGDPVTFPGAGFALVPGAATRVDVHLDLVR